MKHTTKNYLKLFLLVVICVLIYARLASGRVISKYDVVNDPLYTKDGVRVDVFCDVRVKSSDGQVQVSPMVMPVSKPVEPMLPVASPMITKPPPPPPSYYPPKTPPYYPQKPTAYPPPPYYPPKTTDYPPPPLKKEGYKLWR